MAKKLKKKALKHITVWAIMISIALPTTGVMIKKIFDHYAHHALRFFTPKQVSCTVSNVFCQKMHDQILAFVNANTSQESLLNFDRATFYNQLQQQFPIVTSLNWRFSVSQTLQLHVVGTTPYCIINDHYILGDQKKLFSKKSFQDFNLANLPHIGINQPLENEKISSTVYNFLHKIQPAMWKQFDISYYAPERIELMPHQSICKCKIITDEKTFFNKRKFIALNTVFTDLCKRGLITKQMLQSQTIPLAFDFRIKDQIIVKFHDSRGKGKGL